MDNGQQALVDEGVRTRRFTDSRRLLFLVRVSAVCIIDESIAFIFRARVASPLNAKVNILLHRRAPLSDRHRSIIAIVVYHRHRGLSSSWAIIAIHRCTSANFNHRDRRRKVALLTLPLVVGSFQVPRPCTGAR